MIRRIPMSDTIKCAIYARYSTNNQREASIEDQIRKCRETAISKGWEVLDTHIYYDKAQSGTRMSTREGLKQMMRVAMGSNCPFQKIIVDDTSRIARNTKEALDIFSILTFYGVHIYYVSQGIDTSHAAAEEMITINGLIDSLHIRNLRSETFRGVEGKVLKGYSGGGKRYGYYSVPVYNGKVDIYGNPEADGYILKINPDETDIVIRIFRLFGEDGYSARKIVNILNKELKETGSPKPPRGEYWGFSTLLGNKKAVRGILNNEIYIGKYYWNRSTSIRNPETGRVSVRLKEKDKWIISSKPELRIISDELWNIVKSRQRQLNDMGHGRYMKTIPAYSANLLTGLMTCGRCGANIVVVSGGKWAKYGCSNNWNKGPVVCSNDIKIKKEEIEKTIVQSLNISFGSDHNISYLIKKVNLVINAKLAQDRPKWKGDALQEQLKKINKEIVNFINAIKAGIITDTVKEQLVSAEKKKNEIEGLLAQAKEDIPEVPSVSEDIIYGYLADIHATLILHPVLGRALLSKIVDKVVIEPFGDFALAGIYCKSDSIAGGRCIVVQIQAHHSQSRSTESCGLRMTVPNESHHMEDNLCLI
jgi:DNA invertase Pin-like site-specific DNA recombinase